jgi:hypothetical protein
MSDVLILAVISGFTVFAWRARKFQLGLYDVRLQKSSQTLVLPASAGQGEGLRVPLSEIVAVSMHRLVRHRPSGRHLSYVPSLDRAVPGGPPQPMRLAEWGWTEPEARTLAGWFSEELGVPFKGVEEETEATSSLAHR